MLRLAIIINLLLAAPVLAQDAGSKIETTLNEWDFGVVKQGEILVHDFELRNQTRKTLNIVNIHTSCGCTVSKAGKKSLRPGEKTKIQVSFNTKGYFGKTKQYAYVNTDDSDNMIIRFTIKAEVIKEDK